mmetsp:Transcript_23595/g.74359  ORF Transcript_23595/g.74359 Transcript_23595/m.74359 type:complete len:205 (+) Transcript_23595:114-728(+)
MGGRSTACGRWSNTCSEAAQPHHHSSGVAAAAAATADFGASTPQPPALWRPMARIAAAASTLVPFCFGAAPFLRGGSARPPRARLLVSCNASLPACSPSGMYRSIMNFPGSGSLRWPTTKPPLVKSTTSKSSTACAERPPTLASTTTVVFAAGESGVPNMIPDIGSRAKPCGRGIESLNPEARAVNLGRNSTSWPMVRIARPGT